MKLFRRMLGIIVAFGMIVGQMMPVAAADEGYTYTIRIFAGAQGSIKGQDVVTITGLNYGDRFSFNQKAVTLNNNSKYYIKGIRESGKDNNTIKATSKNKDVVTSSPSFVVTGDMDYVVGYGLLGDAVAYTVNYVDNKGETLAPSETYYGNLGDKPVIAYLYIDGYVPQAYNLTGKLLEDPAKNQFTFVYTPLSELGGGYTFTPGETIIHERIVYEDGGVIVIGGDPNGNAANGNGNANANAAGNDTINIGDDSTPAANGPAELIDIRDDQVPLMDRIFGEDSEPITTVLGDFASGIPISAKIASVAGVVLVAALATWMILSRKKKEDSNEA